MKTSIIPAKNIINIEAAMKNKESIIAIPIFDFLVRFTETIAPAIEARKYAKTSGKRYGKLKKVFVTKIIGSVKKNIVLIILPHITPNMEAFQDKRSTEPEP